jgi:two-component system NtrC family sensor kinase
MAMLDDAAADLRQTVAALQRELDQCTAERDEALAREAALAEVLHVINSSPGNPAPVFDAILEKAHTLCGATLGSLVLYDGERLRAIATRGYPEEYAALARKGGPAHMVTAIERLLRGERLVHVPDAAVLTTLAPLSRAGVEIAGIRTALFVPLRKDGALPGYVSAQRQEVRPFSEREIALVESFAALTQQHGGTIEVDSRVGEFTEFTIHLPRFRQAATAVSSTRTRAAGN